MAYDQTGFTQRFMRCIPRAWFSDAALVLGGNTYALLNAVATAPTSIKAAMDYHKLQTRIATATDQNLEAIAQDFLGLGYPRYSLYNGKDLVPETDPQYSQRIRNNIVAPQNTLAAIQSAVTQYLNTLYIEESVSNVRLLGLDTAGGVDTWGGLDGRSKSTPNVPLCTTFDRQSNPKLSAKIGLTPGQFCVLFTYGGLNMDGFILGRTHVGMASHLLNGVINIVQPLTSSLSNIVEQTKAHGTQAVYADNRTA